jgi:glycosyltransferase involved in cell wall biosynthesis
VQPRDLGVVLALEQRGYEADIWSLRQPTDKYVHPMHNQIQASRHYLPEYLHDAPWRVARAVFRSFRQPHFMAMSKLFWRDLKRDPTVNRLRRFGQACVLADEIDPGIRHAHVHFLHTPGSVVRYMCALTGRTFSFSAHAKDIWTIPDWEKREKIGDSLWGVTCTKDGLAELQRAAGQDAGNRAHLVYHGLDIARFPDPPTERNMADGREESRPVRLVSVGRAVEKKGFDDLISALALLSPDLNWTLIHIGSGPLIGPLTTDDRRTPAPGAARSRTWRSGGR